MRKGGFEASILCWSKGEFQHELIHHNGLCVPAFVCSYLIWLPCECMMVGITNVWQKAALSARLYS